VLTACSSVLALGVGDSGESGDEIGPPPLPQVRPNYVYPPLPPSLQKGQELIESVLNRFPEIDPGEIMAIVHEEFPREMRRFRAIAITKSGDALELLTRVVGEALDLLEAKRRDPDLYQLMRSRRRLDRTATELGRAAQRSDGEKKKKLLTELQTTLEESFRVKQKVMKAEVEQVERELDDLRELINRRELMRGEIVGRRISELTENTNDLEW